MSSNILHLGSDHCHRIEVFESAGFSTFQCQTLVQLEEALGSDPNIGAIVLTEQDCQPPADLVLFARAHTPAPLILFHDATCDIEKDLFDLVVPSHVPPSLWLGSVAALLADDPLPAQQHAKSPAEDPDPVAAMD